MTRSLSEVAVALAGGLVVAAVITAGTVVIDDTNNRPISVSQHRGG
jgi:hypothetical protein